MHPKLCVVMWFAQWLLLAYSVEKLVCEMSDFAPLVLMRGLCSG